MRNVICNVSDDVEISYRFK